jgi:gas vesicle protein
VLGSLISAAAVLLLTPKKGGAVRADIKREVDSILEEGRRASQVRRDELEAQFAQMRGDTGQHEQKNA